VVICVWNLTLIHACGIDAEIKKKGNASFKIKYCKCNLDMWHKLITILQCNKLTKEIMRDHPFVGCTFYTHWKHIWHMDKCVNKWNMKLLMNKYHTKFVVSYKSMCQMCFQSTILVCEMYKLWMNESRTISIIKLWDAKFVIMYFIVIQKICCGPWIITT